MAQVIEHLPSKYEALSSNSTITKNVRNYPCSLVDQLFNLCHYGLRY
jgi:hypothetical protein